MYSSGKKKNKHIKSYEDIYRPKNKRWGTSSKKYFDTFNETYSSANIQIRVLKKEVNECMKNNAELRRRMN